jgi:hypothetical protein
MASLRTAQAGKAVVTWEDSRSGTRTAASSSYFLERRLALRQEAVGALPPGFPGCARHSLPVGRAEGGGPPGRRLQECEYRRPPRAPVPSAMPGPKGACRRPICNPKSENVGKFW